jgi:Uma2 family endonuclease
MTTAIVDRAEKPIPVAHKRPTTRIITDHAEIQIPAWVVDLESFRRWTDAEEFPEDGRICYLKGEVWVDMSREQVFTHNQVKLEYTLVVGGLVKTGRSGRFFPDGLRLINLAADISSVPDGTFISAESLRTGRVRFVEGAQEGYVEVEGVPDMVLEIISASSVHKDNVLLRQAYWEAGIREYWLVDARGESIRFDIFRYTPKGYVATRKQAGWLKSAVFGKSFRLSQRVDPLGHPEYTLAVR